MGKSTINVPFSIAVLNYQRGMLAGFPMKFLHLKQFVDHMNVEYGNGLSLIVVTHAVASWSTRLRHSKVKKSLGKWPFGNEKRKKQQSNKFRILMDFQKNNEFLWKIPMSFGKKTMNSYEPENAWPFHSSLHLPSSRALMKSVGLKRGSSWGWPGVIYRTS